METRNLAGLDVSFLGYGLLALSHLQYNLSAEAGGDLIMYAFDHGINFFDTAQFYETYDHVGHAVKSGYKDFILSTKSYAYDRRSAREAFDEAAIKTHKETIDVFLVHETQSLSTIKGHFEALLFYLEMKQKGYIKAVGISTHYVSAVRSAALIPEIDVIEALINVDGIGIPDGDSADMSKAIDFAAQLGKSVIAMKPFGGGNLYHKAYECLDYLYGMKPLSTILIGMHNRGEIDANLSYFSHSDSMPLFLNLKGIKRHLKIEDWCIRCGRCVSRCSAKALHLSAEHLSLDDEKCIRCGYCSSVCPEMALKLLSMD